MFSRLPVDVLVLIAVKVPIIKLELLWRRKDTDFTVSTYGSDTFRVSYLKALMHLDYYTNTYGQQDSLTVLSDIIKEQPVAISNIDVFIRWVIKWGLDQVLPLYLDQMISYDYEVCHKLLFLTLEVNNEHSVVHLLQYLDLQLDHDINGEIKRLQGRHQLIMKPRAAFAYLQHRRPHLDDDFASALMMAAVQYSIPIPVTADAAYKYLFYHAFHTDNLTTFTWLYKQLNDKIPDDATLVYRVLAEVLVIRSATCPRICQFIVNEYTTGAPHTMMLAIQLNMSAVMIHAAFELKRASPKIVIDPQYILATLDLFSYDKLAVHNVISVLCIYANVDKWLYYYQHIKRFLTMKRVRKIMSAASKDSNILATCVGMGLLCDPEMIEYHPYLHGLDINAVDDNVYRLLLTRAKCYNLYPSAFHANYVTGDNNPRRLLAVADKLGTCISIQTQGEPVLAIYKEQVLYLRGSGRYRLNDGKLGAIVFGLKREEVVAWRYICTALNIIYHE